MINPNRIPQRPPKPDQFNLHHIAVFEFYFFAETENVRAKKMNVRVAGSAMLGVFEMMMFEVRNRVRHLLFASLKRLLPKGFSAALD